MKIIGVNGIRTDGSTTTSMMLADLHTKGWSVKPLNHPRVWLWQARSRKRQYEHAKMLLDLHDPGDCVIAHSRGGLTVLRAMELGAMFSQVFLFGAAMNQDFTFPFMGMKALFNVHNPADKALGLGSLLWRHDFGPMGQTGYKGPPDPRIANVLARPAVSEYMDHSNYFLPINRKKWVKYIDFKLLAAGESPA
jgi:hypothetical protein